MNKLMELGSYCCGTEIDELDEVVVSKIPGVTDYYYHRCTKCGKPCWIVAIRVWDSDGVEIKPGDVIEVPACEGMGDQFHIAFIDPYNHLDIRDLGANNTGMYNIYGEYYNRGSWRNHLHMFDQEDIEYYGLERY